MIKIFKTITMTLLKNFVIPFVLLFLISSSEYKKDNIITLHQIKNNVVINKIPEIEKLIKKRLSTNIQ
ncbi:MAG: hypothetical protein HFI73_06560 [Bacilli bacterium]|jgi:uncharacterized membrane protein|nr:hypothetical protein [Bacilli bacterium]